MAVIEKTAWDHTAMYLQGSASAKKGGLVNAVTFAQKDILKGKIYVS